MVVNKSLKVAVCYLNSNWDSWRWISYMVVKHPEKIIRIDR